MVFNGSTRAFHAFSVGSNPTPRSYNYISHQSLDIDASST